MLTPVKSFFVLDSSRVELLKSGSSSYNLHYIVYTAVAGTLIRGGGCLFIYSCSARLVSFEIKFKFINLKRN